MKKRRFFCCFLALLLMAALCAPVIYAEEAVSEETEETAEQAGQEEEAPSLLPPDPNIQAGAALLVDLNDNGKMIYGMNERARMYPASLTKIMTALLTFEAIDAGELSMDTEVTVSSIVRSMPAGSSTAGLKEGEIVTVRYLLDCLLVASANESADILAETVSGSVTGFVQAMNRRALELGCEDTHYVNSHGFHNEDHYTSAWDMSLITREALKYPEFLEICDTDRVILPPTNLGPERTLLSTNHLISLWRNRNYRNPEVHGVKTGSTDAAGNCLVATAQRDRKHFLSVIMGAENVQENGVMNLRSFSETTRLFNWGFDNFHYATVIEAGEMLREVPVELSKTDHVMAVTARGTEALMPVKVNADTMERTIRLSEETLTAPVEAGQRLGTVEMSYGGVSYGTVELLASHEAEVSKLLSAIKTADEWIHKPAVWIGGGIVAAAALILAVRSLIFGGQRYRYGKAVTGRRGGYRGKKRY